MEKIKSVIMITNGEDEFGVPFIEVSLKTEENKDVFSRSEYPYLNNLKRPDLVFKHTIISLLKEYEKAEKKDDTDVMINAMKRMVNYDSHSM